MPLCLALSTMWGSRVKRSNPGNGVAPSLTPRCSSYWKGSLQVTLDYSRQLNFTKLVTNTLRLLISIWPFFFSINQSTRFQDDLHTFKMNSSDISIHSSSIAVLREPTFGWDVEIGLFSKTLHIIKGVIVWAWRPLGNFNYFGIEFLFWLGFGV